MKSKYFSIQELVPPAIYEQFGERSWQFIDPRAGAVLDAIRELVGTSVTINTWNSDGDNVVDPHEKFESGFRMPETKTGGKLSQHKFGRGFDLRAKFILKNGVLVPLANYEDFRNLIRYNFEYLNSLGLTTIEKDTPTWLHIDLRYTGLDYLYEVPFQ